MRFRFIFREKKTEYLMIMISWIFTEKKFHGLTPHLNANTNQTVYTTNEYFNLFSDTSIYWVDWGGADGLRMQQSITIHHRFFRNKLFYEITFRKDNIIISARLQIRTVITGISAMNWLPENHGSGRHLQQKRLLKKAV